MSDNQKSGFDSSSKVHHIHGGPRDGGPRGPDLEARVHQIEKDVSNLRETLGRIDERLIGMSGTIATKADLEAIRGEVKEVKGTLSGKLGYWQFVTTLVAMLGLAVGAATFLMRWLPGV